MVDGIPAVIDASFALKLVLPDPLRDRCRSALDALLHQGHVLVAPTLWAYETTSVLCKAIHFGHLTADEGRRAVEQLAELGVRLIAPDAAQNLRALEWSLRLGRAAAYDSYYLVLAEALGCRMWTADRRLAGAADAPWALWVGEDER